MGKWKKIILAIVLFAGLCGLGHYLYSLRKIGKQSNPPSSPNPNQPEIPSWKPTAERVRTELVAQGLNGTASKILTAVAMHETGLFTSKIFKENNNLYGMKQPVRRATVSLGAKNGYASYASISDSIEDLLLWFDFHDKQVEDINKMGTVANVVTFMKSKGYFESELNAYTWAVEKHFKNL